VGTPGRAITSSHTEVLEVRGGDQQATPEPAPWSTITDAQADFSECDGSDIAIEPPV
jgi:hypothetical protein